MSWRAGSRSHSGGLVVVLPTRLQDFGVQLLGDRGKLKSENGKLKETTGGEQMEVGVMSPALAVRGQTQTHPTH